MVKYVMIQLCKYLLGLSFLALHILFDYLLMGWTATLVIMGVQLLITGGLVRAMIRAPD